MTAPRQCDPAEVIALNEQGLTQREIANRVGIHQSSVCELLRRHGVKSSGKHGGVRRYFFNEEYFANVETPDQAYWLGFLAADGFVVGKRQGVGLGLAVKDVAHLKLFRSAVGADSQPLTFVPPAPGYGGIGIYHLRLYSKQIARDAERYGIVPQKTRNCTPWNPPVHLASHYWRGLIDGDGHIAPDGKSMAFCGTRPMVEAFRLFASDSCGTTAKPRQAPGMWTLGIQGRHQVHAMLTLLYSEDSVGLARKKDLALRITAEPDWVQTSPPCRMPRCPRLSIARLLCGKHYQRWKKHGDPSVSLIDRG